MGHIKINTLSEKEIEKKFFNFQNPEQIYQYILELGKQSDVFKLKESFKVKGCETSVWLKYSFQNNKFSFFAHCENPFIQGLVNICIIIFNNKTKIEILEYNFDFFIKTKIIHFLSPRRKIGVAHLINQFKKYVSKY